MSEICNPQHDWVANLLTAFLCCGLVVSYLPQHFRIIHKNSSEGFSPWFLLLGSTSSASAMMNMFTLQWGILKCCKVLSPGNCLEMTAGILMVGLQWFLFSVIFVLYIMYYPPHLKYVGLGHGAHVSDDQPLKPKVPSHNWKLSTALALGTLVHLSIIVFTTFFRLITNKPIAGWATFLGVSSAILAAIQYLPQLIHTFRIKLVGALSIPTMIMQSPGAVFFVISIALRPGTNWTSWITYAVAGSMQAILLVMCLAWKVRQRQLGIDDFGHPLGHAGDESEPLLDYGDEAAAGESTPLLGST